MEFKYTQDFEQGDAYSFLAYKRETDFFSAFSVGKWIQQTCDELYSTIAKRTQQPTYYNKINFCTDGNEKNENAIPKFFNKDCVNYGQVIKDKEMQIVFQASHKAMENKTLAQIVSGIKAYGDSLAYVLIDPSGGRGLEFDLKQSVQLYQELREKCSDLVIGFAGGFTGENVESRLTDLILMIQSEEFCIDAEGGLRDKLTLAYGDDLLNPLKVRNYLQNAAKALK